VPLHGTYTVLSGRESNWLRAITSVFFAVSLYLIYAYLAVTVFGISIPPAK
jgi:hypothetical protein